MHGLVGETGAGKSLTAWSVLGLLPDGLRRTAGSIMLDGTDLATCDEDHLRAIRGRDVAMIVQNPRTALVPTMTVGDQLALVHRARTGSSRKQSRARQSRPWTRYGFRTRPGAATTTRTSSAAARPSEWSSRWRCWTGRAC